MSDYEFDAPETMEGGGTLDTEGHFLFLVHDLIDGQTTKGNVITGFTLILEVIDGDTRVDGVCPQKGMLFKPVLFGPKLSDEKDQQERAKRQHTAFFIAANVIGPAQLDTIRAIAAARAAGTQPPKMKLDIKQSVNQLIVMNCRRYKKPNDDSDNKGDLRPHFADIYHVDDPRAKVVPLDKTLASFIPPEHRRKPEELQAIKDAFSGKSSGAAPKAPPPPSSNDDDELGGL